MTFFRPPVWRSGSVITAVIPDKDQINALVKKKCTEVILVVLDGRTFYILSFSLNLELENNFIGIKHKSLYTSHGFLLFIIFPTDKWSFRIKVFLLGHASSENH